jgi:hypothetical protein
MSCTAPTAHSSRARTHPRAKQCQHHPKVQLHLQGSSTYGCNRGCLELQSLCWRGSGSITRGGSSSVDCCSSCMVWCRTTASLIVSAQPEAVVASQHMHKVAWLMRPRNLLVPTADAGGVCGLLRRLLHTP